MVWNAGASIASWGVSADDRPQQVEQLPLVLLVAAGGAEGGDRAPSRSTSVGVSVVRGRRPGRSADGEALVEPGHLQPGAEAEAELGDGRGGLQPAARRGGRDDVAPAVDDVDVAGVAAGRGGHRHGRLAGAGAARRGLGGQRRQRWPPRRGTAAGPELVRGALGDEGAGSAAYSAESRRSRGPAATGVGVAVVGVAVGERSLSASRIGVRAVAVDGSISCVVEAGSAWPAPASSTGP